MTYDVIGTGSSGNAVVINDSILVDIGLPWKKIQPYAKALKLVLLTHEHGDHFKPSTVRALHNARPSLRFGCCEWMVSHLLDAGVDKRCIDVLEPKTWHQYLFCVLMPEPLFHNVPNCGYHLMLGSEKLFYATDTGTLAGIEAKGYDLYLIESNHGEAEIAERIAAKQAAGEFAYEYRAAENHLSEEQALDWIYQNIGPNGRYAFLHQHQRKDNEE